LGSFLPRDQTLDGRAAARLAVQDLHHVEHGYVPVELGACP
jgi:hypothetical protein